VALQGRGASLCALAVSIFLLCPAAGAAAQSDGATSFELRLDGFAGGRESPAALHAGVGATRSLGTYAQLHLAGGAGPSEDGTSAHLEAAARFHLDPFRQRRWGVYGAAGAGVHRADSTEPFLLVLLGAEGPRLGSWAPALELGLSRGVRIGVALRRGAPERR
jgi:hypothetical protein